MTVLLNKNIKLLVFFIFFYLVEPIIIALLLYIYSIIYRKSF